MEVWVFPGQGAQRPHMAAGLAQAPPLLRIADRLLDTDLSALCLEDAAPQWDPVLVQPALFVVGVAAARALIDTGRMPDAVIGHSFGEFAALTAMGAMPFGTGLRLTAERARAMAACADGSTGMLAVLGLPTDEVRAVCAELSTGGARIGISNVNSPDQTVIAGDNAALAEAEGRCRSRGAFRTRVVRVPYAAHTALMAPAAERLRAALADVRLERPAAPLHSCVTRERTSDPRRLAELLVLGMTRPVDFCGAVRSAGADTFLEVGPGSPPRLLGAIRDSLDGEPVRLALVSNDEQARTPQVIARNAAVSGSVRRAD